MQVSEFDNTDFKLPTDKIAQPPEIGVLSSLFQLIWKAFSVIFSY